MLLCKVCHTWMHNEVAFEDHVMGKHHKKQEKRFHAFAQGVLHSVVDKVLLDFQEAGIYVRTLLVAKIATKSPVKWLAPVKKFLLQRTTTIIHSDPSLRLLKRQGFICKFTGSQTSAMAFSDVYLFCMFLKSTF